MVRTRRLILATLAALILAGCAQVPTRVDPAPAPVQDAAKPASREDPDPWKHRPPTYVRPY